MKRVLEHLLHRLDFLYLDPKYRFVDSRSSGNTFVNAWVVLASQSMLWLLEADREQIVLSVSAASTPPGTSWFWTTLVRQHLDGGPEITSTLLTAEDAEWVRVNLTRIEMLFKDQATSTASHHALTTLMQENVAARGWAPILG